ncbi:MAG: sigma-70 family RNA polymerase sigma factor [Pseudobdellovibrio sp.]|nr:sigma-70 family RNA polymerase sigma factor [Pseudobdellovibrio sp.]
MTNYLIDLKNALTSKEQSRFLELFYNETAHLVFAFCRKKGITPQDGEDIVQIVYTKVYNKREKYNPDYSPLAWLFVITKSEAKDYLKKSAIYADYMKDYGLFADLSQNQAYDPSSKQEGQELDLSALSSKEKSALEQRYFAEKDFREIAETLGVTETNVRKIISRAIHKLKG